LSCLTRFLEHCLPPKANRATAEVKWSEVGLVRGLAG